MKNIKVRGDGMILAKYLPIQPPPYTNGVRKQSNRKYLYAESASSIEGITHFTKSELLIK